MTASGSRSGAPQRFGKYTLLDKIAEGGMAEIFLAAEDTPHTGQRFVIVKRIRPERAPDPDYQSFFLSEARVSLQCAHPNLPQIYELDRVGGVYYLAMEMIRGHTLLEYLRACHRRRARASVAAVAAVGLDVAAALEHAHDLCDVTGTPLGVIHRDVSPQNIVIDASGATKLIDFGVARSALQAHRTRTGVVKGKLSYLAPELLRGGGAPDHRADLFSLGVVLYESLAGRALFRGRSDRETLENLRAARVRDLVEIRAAVPRPLADAIHRCLERDPERRHQGASDLLRALDGATRETGIHPSRLALRDEVRAACGPPARPEAYWREEAGREPGPLLSPELAERDPELAYFLRRAGA